MEMTENNFVTMLEESIKPLHTGETVTGIVYAITDNEIYLDLGAKFTGVIVKEQITEDASAKLQDMFKVGDEVTAFVIRVEDGKGMATLSKTRVDRDRSWIVLKEAFEKGENLEGVVNAVVKGGVVMTVAGNRVFVPASQTGIAKDGDMSVLVGTTQRVRLIEFDEGKKKALGSIKVILNEEKKAAEEAIWQPLRLALTTTVSLRTSLPTVHSLISAALTVWFTIPSFLGRESSILPLFFPLVRRSTYSSRSLTLRRRESLSATRRRKTTPGSSSPRSSQLAISFPLRSFLLCPSVHLPRFTRTLTA